LRRVRERLTGLDPARVDEIVAVAVIIELELESWLSHGYPAQHRLVIAVASVLFAAPIAVRRRWPLGALMACAGVCVIQALLGANIVNDLNGALLPPVLLGYAAGAWLESRAAVTAILLGAILLGLTMLLADVVIASNGGSNFAGDLGFFTLLVSVPWFVGRLARDRSRRAAAFRELAARAAAEHDARERAAVTRERSRIGGELQDIIAHSVSAMVIQAGGARRLLRTNPELARDSILAVERTGREALADLRRLLGMLRKDDDPRALAPQPGLNQLAALVESMHEQSVACELRTEGSPIDLTPGIDLVGYRVVEAALHSVARRHGRRATVTVRYRPERLQLEIRGDGAALDLGRELRAMSERVALYDGRLEVLPADGDGWALDARLPLGTVPV
jgi:signal transduction histidine kinase